MTTADKEGSFVLNYYKAAIAVGRQFKLSALVILTQAALESAWGTSTLAKQYNNFFGMTAGGKPNAYWQGQTYTAASSGLKFRVYPSVSAGFSDFARVITTNYKDAAAVSGNINAYATKISQSAYISEKNGDNRDNYKKTLINIAASISGLSKKQVPKKAPTGLITGAIVVTGLALCWAAYNWKQKQTNHETNTNSQK